MKKSITKLFLRIFFLLVVILFVTLAAKSETLPKPTEFIATDLQTSGVLKLTWKWSGSQTEYDLLAEFEMLRKSPNDADFVNIGFSLGKSRYCSGLASTLNCEYEDKKLTNGNLYKYKIRAVSALLLIPPFFIVSDFVETSGTPTFKTPTNLTVTNTKKGGSLSLSWNWFSSFPSTFSYFDIHRCQGINCIPASVPLHSSTITYEDTGLTNDVTYCYKIIAVPTDWDNNPSSPSNIACGVPTAPPLAIDNITVTPIPFDPSGDNDDNDNLYPLKISYSLSKQPDTVTIKILGWDGKLVKQVSSTFSPLVTKQIFPAINTFEWDGFDDNHKKVQEGCYTFSVEAISGGKTEIKWDKTYIILVLYHVGKDPNEAIRGWENACP